MKIRVILAWLVCFVAAAVASGRPAAASEVLYDSSGFIQGQQSFSQSFALTGPGTLTVTLSNINWPTSLSSLNILLATSGGLLGPEMGEGVGNFKFKGGTVFAEWFGTAQGPLDTGVYGVNICWTPTPVPLPTSIALLVSGLALLLWQRRTRGGTVRGDLATN